MIAFISTISVLFLAFAASASVLPPSSASFSNICTPGGLRAARLAALPLAASAGGLNAAEDQALLYTFFFTHYEFIGDPQNPEGVKYTSDGQPSAKAADGSAITMTGQGAWNPASQAADGGGQYTVKDANGAVTAQGSWRVTGFISFEQLELEDWWGIPGFTEEGWQGGPDSVSFSGFLTINVNLDGLGDGLLRAWCLMPTAGMQDTHVGDGISLVGDNFDFAGSEQAELSMFENMEGVMFYSTDANATGWLQNPAGIAVVRDQGLKGYSAPSSGDDNGYNPK